MNHGSQFTVYCAAKPALAPYLFKQVQPSKNRHEERNRGGLLKLLAGTVMLRLQDEKHRLQLQFHLTQHLALLLSGIQSAPVLKVGAVVATRVEHRSKGLQASCQHQLLNLCFATCKRTQACRCPSRAAMSFISCAAHVHIAEMHAKHLIMLPRMDVQNQSCRVKIWTTRRQLANCLSAATVCLTSSSLSQTMNAPFTYPEQSSPPTPALPACQPSWASRTQAGSRPDASCSLPAAPGICHRLTCSNRRLKVLNKHGWCKIPACVASVHTACVVTYVWICSAH